MYSKQQFLAARSDCNP